MRYSQSIVVRRRGIYGYISRYSGSGIDIFTDIVELGDYIYVAGRTNSPTVIGGVDVFVIKFDLDGAIVSKKRLGSVNLDQFFGIMTDGTYIYLCGYTFQNIGGSGDKSYVVKLDTNLNLIDDKIYYTIQYNWFNDIKYDSNTNHIYAVGLVSPSYTNPAFTKIDTSLNLVAHKYTSLTKTGRFEGVDINNTHMIAVGGVDNSGDYVEDTGYIVWTDTSFSSFSSRYHYDANKNYFYDVALDSGDNAYIIGYTAVGGVNKPLLVKIDLSTGNILLSKKLDISYSGFFSGVIVDGSDIYVCGEVEDGSSVINGIVMKLNASLEVQKQILLSNTDDYLSCHKISKENNYIILAAYENIFSASYDGLMIKLSLPLSAGKISNPSKYTITNSSYGFVDSNLSTQDPSHSYVDIPGYNTSDVSITETSLLLNYNYYEIP